MIELNKPELISFKPAKRSLAGTGSNNVIISLGGAADFTARKEIHITGEFNAKEGSEVHIYCTPTFPDCADFTTYLMQRTENIFNTENYNSEIELSFIYPIDKENVSIFPNPSSGIFSVSVNSKEKFVDLKVENTIGELILSKNINSNLAIDLSAYPKGIYFLKLETKTNLFIKKIIIQ